MIAPGGHTDPLLAARGARYGAFVDNASISQALALEGHAESPRLRRAPQ